MHRGTPTNILYTSSHATSASGNGCVQCVTQNHLIKRHHCQWHATYLQPLLPGQGGGDQVMPGIVNTLAASAGMCDFPQGESLHSSCQSPCISVCLFVFLCVCFMILSDLGRLVECALLYVCVSVCLCLCVMASSISPEGT